MLLLKRDAYDVDLRYLLGLLNSRLLGYYYSQYFITIDVLKNALLALPIINFPGADDVQQALQKQVILLVEKILSKKSRNTDADITALENEINQQVYALYGLTPEEIAIVEGATN